MAALAGLFADGRIVDLVLLLVAAEAGALWLWRRRAARGPTWADLLPNLLAGAFLLLALRAALAGMPWIWIAAPLTGALLAHLADLARRFGAGGVERQVGSGGELERRPV
ncbi:hypothetical protein F0L46_07455 [Salinarimonas soli]|uniref:Uncharacterized protein n=1 Tax=Salinarimonas soli TaxID=1638099 RepID=A0A5B2VGR0_9HYPH|nr:hypothetical protein F0L46_07455 [Salinarimonas soli]